MAKDRPLPNELIDGVGDKIEGLGKPSPITRAVRKPTAQEVLPPGLDPRAVAAAMSTDLRSKGRMTLADRVKKEGIAAYGKSFADRAAAAKKKRGAKEPRS